MSRSYLVFGSDDGRLWVPIGTVVADSHSQAQDTAADQVSGYSHYGSTPERNWQSRIVSEKTVRNWSEYPISDSGQMTFEEGDREAQERVDELVEKAKDALDRPLAKKGDDLLG